MKQQINFRASDLTGRQIEWLMQKWGTSQTETLTVVIDRIYQQENKTMTAQDAVAAAQADPETWYPQRHPDFPRGIAFAQVCFGNGVFTVADNGDAEDYTDPPRAAEALELEWKRALQSE